MLRIWRSIASSHEDTVDQNEKKLIMIVGKDSHFSYLMQRFVGTNAHRVIPVNFSDDVLSLARGEKPVAIVLEVNTPETIGWQTLRILKSDPQTAKIPVIVCSWLDESARSLVEGADVYLRMPILYKEFGAMLAAILTQEDNGPNH
jgi:CheY-like chemotaxis protein